MSTSAQRPSRSESFSASSGQSSQSLGNAVAIVVEPVEEPRAGVDSRHRRRRCRSRSGLLRVGAAIACIAQAVTIACRAAGRRGWPVRLPQSGRCRSRWARPSRSVSVRSSLPGADVHVVADVVTIAVDRILGQRTRIAGIRHQERRPDPDRSGWSWRESGSCRSRTERHRASSSSRSLKPVAHVDVVADRVAIGVERIVKGWDIRRRHRPDRHHPRRTAPG